MAPEWVGDVMNSAIGWLLDVTVERNAATLQQQIDINHASISYEGMNE
ncbi:MAG: hypothetical protein WAM42_00575 [Candidatus Nitrosopolaris sp.]